LATPASAFNQLHHHTAMAEKKRKRNDQGGERPTKKAAFAPQTKIKVELLKNDEALGPLLGAQL
jgi:DNA-directed RNA polymerase I subunit RPA49